MRYPIVVDGRNLFKPDLMHHHGFTYISVGRPAVCPEASPEPVSQLAARAAEPQPQRQRRRNLLRSLSIPKNKLAIPV